MRTIICIAVGIVAMLVVLPAKSLPLAEFDPSVLSSLGWAMPSTSPLTASDECPFIEGRYSISGEEYFVVNDGGAGTKNQKTITSPVVFFSHARETRDSTKTELPSASEQTEPDTFSVQQNRTEGKLVVRMIAPRDPTKVVQTTLHNQPTDFLCKDRKLHFVSKTFNGHSDGVTSNFDSKSFVMNLTDGSLFYYETSRNVSKSLFVFTNSRLTQRYIRFLRHK
jgi:hypothetical protein